MNVWALAAVAAVTIRRWSTARSASLYLPIEVRVPYLFCWFGHHTPVKQTQRQCTTNQALCETFSSKLHLD
jgi:hypothetical protein